VEGDAVSEGTIEDARQLDLFGRETWPQCIGAKVWMARPVDWPARHLAFNKTRKEREVWLWRSEIGGYLGGA
jgi:myo-inositol catabolism protein IolC